MDPFTLRRADMGDLETLVGQRRAMFRDMGSREVEALDRMAEAYRGWLRPRLQSQEYLGWLALAASGQVAAGAGLWLMDWPPHLLGGGGRRGNIVNVYTEPPFRRSGLARRLTNAVLDWCRGQGVSVVILHASDQGRPLYASLGFESTNEMRLLLE